MHRTRFRQYTRLLQLHLGDWEWAYYMSCAHDTDDWPLKMYTLYMYNVHMYMYMYRYMHMYMYTHAQVYRIYMYMYMYMW